MTQVMNQATEERSPRENASAFIDAVHRLNDDFAIPTDLRELGVERKKLSSIAEEVVSSKPPNPREYELDDIEVILQKAY